MHDEQRGFFSLVCVYYHGVVLRCQGAMRLKTHSREWLRCYYYLMQTKESSIARLDDLLENNVHTRSTANPIFQWCIKNENKNKTKKTTTTWTAAAYQDREERKNIILNSKLVQLPIFLHHSCFASRYFTPAVWALSRCSMCVYLLYLSFQRLFFPLFICTDDYTIGNVFLHVVIAIG